PQRSKNILRDRKVGKGHPSVIRLPLTGDLAKLTTEKRRLRLYRHSPRIDAVAQLQIELRLCLPVK
ncbi:MAG TPA: hypothetical protein DCR32_07915, partial [Opitutae bacterium]|nr:hypothetical protein [Opitutae bacterium]